MVSERELFQYQSTQWSKVHLKLVSVPTSGFSSRKFAVVSNPKGKVDVIESLSTDQLAGGLQYMQLHQEPLYKQLNIDLMQCSLAQGGYLFIGALNKLFLIDMTRDFTIISQCCFKRHVFSICAVSTN